MARSSGRNGVDKNNKSNEINENENNKNVEENKMAEQSNDLTKNVENADTSLNGSVGAEKETNVDVSNTGIKNGDTSILSKVKIGDTSPGRSALGNFGEPSKALDALHEEVDKVLADGLSKDGVSRLADYLRKNNPAAPANSKVVEEELSEEKNLRVTIGEEAKDENDTIHLSSKVFSGGAGSGVTGTDWTIREFETGETKFANIMVLDIKKMVHCPSSNQRKVIRSEDDFMIQISELYREINLRDSEVAADLVQRMLGIDRFEDAYKSLIKVAEGKTTYGQNLTSDLEIYRFFYRKNSSLAGTLRKAVAWFEALIFSKEISYFVTVEKVRNYVMLKKDSRKRFGQTTFINLYKEEMAIGMFQSYITALDYLKGKYILPSKIGSNKLSSNTVKSEIIRQRLAMRQHLLSIAAVDDVFDYVKKALTTRIFNLTTTASKEDPSVFFGDKLSFLASELCLVSEVLKSKTLIIDALKDTSSAVTYRLKIDRALQIIESVKTLEYLDIGEVLNFYSVSSQKDIRGLTSGMLLVPKEKKTPATSLIHYSCPDGAESAIIIKDAYKNLNGKVQEVSAAINSVLENKEVRTNFIKEVLATLPPINGYIKPFKDIFGLSIPDTVVLAIALNNGVLEFTTKTSAAAFSNFITKELIEEDEIQLIFRVNHNGSRISKEIVGALPADMCSMYLSPEIFLLDQVSRDLFKSSTEGGLVWKEDELNIGVFDDVIELESLATSFDASAGATLTAIVDGKKYTGSCSLETVLRGENIKGSKIVLDNEVKRILSESIHCLRAASLIADANSSVMKERDRAAMIREAELPQQEFVRLLFNSAPSLRVLAELTAHQIFVKIAKDKDEDYFAAQARTARTVYNQIGAQVLLFSHKLLEIADCEELVKLIEEATKTHGIQTNFKDYFGMVVRQA